MPNNVSNKLKKELKKLTKSWIIMLETTKEKLVKIDAEVLSILTQKGFSGILLFSSMPHPQLIQLCKKNNIDTKNLHIICCLCNQVSSKDKNITHTRTQSIKALTEISMAFSKPTEKFIGKKSFFFLDSVSGMSMQNNPRQFATFIHSTLVNLRHKNMNGVLISIENEINKEVRAEVTQFCDKVVKI